MKKEFPDISFNGDIWRKFNDIESFESQVHSGDTSQIWSSQIVATQHRMPCYKLGGVKFCIMDIIKKFLDF
ncbi:MAG: hypothetical protein ACM3VV_04915 [Deltaproteobacteria bacterium]